MNASHRVSQRPWIRSRLVVCLGVVAGAACLALNQPASALAPQGARELGAEAALAKLQQRETAARQDMIRWLLETDVRDEHLAEKDVHLLSHRIEHRVQITCDAYKEFRAHHPSLRMAEALEAEFRADADEDLVAIRHWEEARRQDPSSPEPWNDLANHLIHNGRVREAFVCFEKSLDLTPRAAVYFFDYANALLLYRTEAMSHYRLTEAEVFDRVLTNCRRGLKLEPESFAFAVQLAQNYYVIKPARPTEGLAAWEHAFQLAQNDTQRDEARTHLARYAIQAGRLGVARVHLDLVHAPHLEPVKDALLRRINEVAKASPAPGK